MNGPRAIRSSILLLISPVMGLILGLKSRDVSYKIWLLIGFVTIYGSTILLTPGSDGLVHQGRVYEHYVDLPLGQFLDESWAVLHLEPSGAPNNDLYIHVLSYFTGTILGAPGLFFVFVSFIYGYFFIRSLFEVIRLQPGMRYPAVLIGLITVFVLWRNVESINTVRTWTGLWVLFYGAIRYYRTGQWRYILLMLAPPLIHIGYLMMAVPAWIVLVFRHRPYVYVGLFVASFFVNFFSQDILIGQLRSTAVGASKVDGYYVEQQLDISQTLEQYQASAWYKALFEAGIQKIAVNVLAFHCILFGLYFQRLNRLEALLFGTGILTITLGNLTWYLYALSERSSIVGALFALASMVLYYTREYEGVVGKLLQYREWILRVVILLFVPFVIFRVADMIYLLSVFLIGMPFIPWLDAELNMSIRQAIAELFQ